MRSIIVSAVLLLTVLWEVRGDLSSGGGDVSDSIPLLASGKRQHNIMRFGKRPASGHSLIHFGKRDEPKGHSFLYFGKRADEGDSSIWDYLGPNRDPSYKRGHAIMRFGKRGPSSSENSHNFIRFGRDGNTEEEKRGNTGGHSMMYFGKRGNNGHSMMYFGKRDDLTDDDDEVYEDKRAHAMIHFGKRGNGHSMMYFGKRGNGLTDDEVYEDKRAHAMIHFGKRGNGLSDDDVYEDKRAHAMIHFGKRDDDEGPNSTEEEKRSNNGHAMMYFGKRGNNGHSMMYFGKRDDLIDDDVYGDKRAHAMIHFGKRDSDGARKSGSHAMIHFGKRDLEEDTDEVEAAAAEQGYWSSPEMFEAKRQHNLLRFGKKDRKGSHAMIHFGKRDVDEDKRAHSMIHFGKRNVEDALQGNQSNKGLDRAKREVGHPLVRYEDPEVEELVSSEEAMYGPPQFWSPIEQKRPEEGEWDPSDVDYYSHPDKKDGPSSKNVFLRFG